MTNLDQNRYEVALRTGRAPLGTVLCMDGFATGHVLAAAGVDFLLIDRQHAAYDWADLENMCWRIQPTGTAVFVRTASDDEAELNLTLDMPIDGVVIPNIESVDQARRAIAAVTFPPEGKRSIGGVRNSVVKNLDFRERAAIRVGLLIEHIHAVEAIDEIMALPGLDHVFVGPHDLAGSMGLDTKTEPSAPPELSRAIDRVYQSARAHGVKYWSWARDGSTALSLRERADAVLWGLDAFILADAAHEMVDRWNQLPSDSTE